MQIKFTLGNRDIYLQLQVSSAIGWLLCLVALMLMSAQVFPFYMIMVVMIIKMIMVVMITMMTMVMMITMMMVVMITMKTMVMIVMN